MHDDDAGRGEARHMDVRIGDRVMQVLLDEATIQARIRELGATLTRDYAGKDFILVTILKGSMLFAADLARAVDLPLQLEFMSVSSYGDDTDSSGVVQVTLDLSRNVAGKDVLLVEDIVDTGLTMRYLLDNLATRHPASLKVCTLLHKPARRRVEVPLDYVGFTIEDHFVIGYGLDYEQRYRNLRYIGYMI